MIASRTGEPSASTTRPRTVPLKSVVAGLATESQGDGGSFDWVDGLGDFGDVAVTGGKQGSGTRGSGARSLISKLPLASVTVRLPQSM